MNISEKKYNEICMKYTRLAKNMKQSLIMFLQEEGIAFHDVRYRIKEYKSFREKIKRKGYKDPWGQTEDLCGVRIICYYQSDLSKIEELIKREFDILENKDKSESSAPKEFGYRSWHFIIKVKDEWLSAPNFRGLDGLKVEIQVRTILMHAWADIEHKLSYKKKEHVPREFVRQFSQLSALLEMADDKFDFLYKEKDSFVNRTLDKEVFDSSIQLNSDSLRAFLDFYFPDRNNLDDITVLVDELMQYNITIKELVDAYELSKDFLSDLEREEKLLTIEDAEGDHKDYLSKEKYLWTQTGVLRTLLDLTCDRYWKDRYMPDEYNELTSLYREKISNRKNGSK